MTTKAKGTSIRQTLINLSVENGVPFQNLETAFILERLVARLTADAELQKHLVYNSERYTLDVDALIVKSDVESILECAKRSAETDLNDGVWFRLEDQVDLGTQGEYGGVRRSNIRELSYNLDKVMEKDIRMLVQERDYEGIRRLLSREPSLANAGVTLGPPCSTTAHPLHRICDAVFAKLITDDEAVEVAKILLEHGARIDGDSSTENADTPLMAAASLHAENLGIFYIQNGARIDLSDKRDGATALHWAAYCGRDMLVDELIRAGVDVNQLDKTYKCTPLVWALQPLMKNEKNNIHHQRTCVRLLLEAGTDISTLDDKTKTFLDDLGTEELEPQDFEFEAKIKLPTINELVVYVPTEDFDVSTRFYEALGFEQTDAWDKTIDCRLGSVVFRLQNYYVKDWAENFMMKFDVNDVDAWHKHAKKVIDEGDYSNARYDEPEMIGDTKICHVWDPCGVLLIFIQ